MAFREGETVADHVAIALASYVSDELISPAARDEVQRIARHLPATLSDFFGFECRLDDDRTVADFLVCCRARCGSLDRLADDSPANKLPDVLRRRPVWQRIQAMAREWARPGSILHDEVHNLWFEFDVDPGKSSLPNPNVFVGSYRLRGDGARHDVEDIEQQCAWLTEQALPILGGGAMDPGIRRQVVRCLHSLPGEASLFQVGLMLARNVPTTRLCTRGLTSNQIVAYLDRVQWPGALQSLANLLDSLDQMVERIDLDLDVNEWVLPKLGLECYLNSNVLGIETFVDHLLSASLCTKLKARTIALWPGTVLYDRSLPVRPGKQHWSTTQRESASCDRFLRRLHHIKLDFVAAAPVRAKAYLGVHYKLGADLAGGSVRVRAGDWSADVGPAIAPPLSGGVDEDAVH